MTELGLSSVSQFIIHRIGNKIREEELILSEKKPPITESISELILRSYLKGLTNKQNQYEFHHETSIEYNEVYSYTKKYFCGEIDFIQFSKVIARLLYAKSLHPNINKGDLFVVEFKDLLINNKNSRAIGLYKFETLDDFLTINSKNNELTIQHFAGINPKLIDKGALIVEETNVVYALDRASSKTKYWLDDFMQIKKFADTTTCEKILLETTKGITQKIKNPVDVAEFINRLRLSSNESDIKEDDITTIASDFITENEINLIASKAQEKHGTNLIKNHHISKKKFENFSKKAQRHFTLSFGVKIEIPQELNIINYQKTENENGTINLMIDLEKAQ